MLRTFTELMVYLVLTVVFTAQCFLSGSLIALELYLSRCSPIIVSGSNGRDANELFWSMTQELVLARFLSGLGRLSREGWDCTWTAFGLGCLSGVRGHGLEA